MPRHIVRPTRVAGPGEPPKVIEEFVGLVNSGTEDVSIARMVAPPDGKSRRRRRDSTSTRSSCAGSSGWSPTRASWTWLREKPSSRGEESVFRYSTPNEEAEYIAICLPAFSPEAMNREG